MKITILLGLIVLLATGGAAQQAAFSLEVTNAKDPLGWKSNEAITNLHATSEGLAGDGLGKDPILIRDGLSIPANPSQIVQITLKTDKPGLWQVFWANSNEPPNDGFRGEKSVNFKAFSGGFQTYLLYPFWQADKKITKLRIDPQDGCRFVIRSMKVLELSKGGKEAVPAFWTFPPTSNGWTAARDARIVSEGAGMIVRVDGPNPLILSPTIDVPADDNLWVTIEMSTRNCTKCILNWTNDEEPGLHATLFQAKPDGKKHYYNIDLSGEPHWRGNIMMLGFAPTGGEKVEATLYSASVSNRPAGLAEIDILYLGLHEAIARVGQITDLEAVIKNTGGNDSKPIHVRLSAPAGIEVVGPGNDIWSTSLAAREERTVRWRVKCVSAGLFEASVKVVSEGNAEEEARAAIRIEPALHGPLIHSSYVPKPQPAATVGYQVGCYYFPGWNDYARWSVLDNYPERKPVLGYYREGSPEVADWHIKWALEHGIKFFIYDWYWSQGGRGLEHALHNGLFNSKYMNLFQFCLLWANHNAAGTSSEADMLAVTKYWIDNYFKRPEYLRIDGKPVVIIFAPRRISEDLGEGATRIAFDKARQLCRDNGLNGLYLVACAYSDADYIKSLEGQGYDALSGYNYPSAGDKGNKVAPYADMVAGYKEIWQEIDNSAAIPYIPVTEPGWDSRPWHGPDARVRTGKDPAKFQQMMANAKEFVDTPGRKLPGGQKLVLVEAWNEWGEGDFIEPHREWGFGYLDAIRNIFSQAPKQHTDITPRDVGLGPYDFPKPGPITAWEFTTQDHGCSYQNMKDVGIRDGALSGVSSGNDPGIILGATLVNGVTYKTAEMRLRVTAGRTGQLFWMGRSGAFSEAKSKRFEIQADGQYHVYKLDMSTTPRWRDTIRQFRLDPTDAANSDIQLDYFRLLP